VCSSAMQATNAQQLSELLCHIRALCCCTVWCAGVRGIVLEAFGVGNFPDLPQQGWVPWLRQQTRKGLQVRQQRIIQKV
jgi:hypothetical protein